MSTRGGATHASPLRQLLGIELAIIQAPMAGVQGSALAVAVSNAGGLGSLPCALLTADALAGELAAIRSQTTKPFNVNFFCHAQPAPSPAREAAWRMALAPYYQELGVAPPPPESGPGRMSFGAEALEILARFRPPVVSFHFGLPTPELVSGVKALGAKVLSSATTVEEARWLEAHGADAIIAQGVEAGGHRGMFLTGPDDTGGDAGARAADRAGGARAGDCGRRHRRCRGGGQPVREGGPGRQALAGRVAQRPDVALGAAGVQVGTAYLLCPEVTTSPVYRAALKSEAARHTALTNVFTGRPARSIVTRLMRELGPLSDLAPAFPLAAAAVAPLRAAAEQQGRGDFSSLWCGQNPSGCRDIPAGELTRQLVAPARAALQ